MDTSRIQRILFVTFLLCIACYTHAQSRTWNSISIIPDSGRGYPLGSLTQNLFTILCDTNTTGLKYWTIYPGLGNPGDVLTGDGAGHFSMQAGGGGGGNFIYNQDTGIQTSANWAIDGSDTTGGNMVVSGRDSIGTSLTVGNNTIVNNSVAFGGSNITSYGFDAAFGFQNTAAGNPAFVIGEGNNSLGEDAFVGGYQSVGSTGGAFAFGDNDTAAGSFSLAMGIFASARNSHSYVFGDGSAVTADSAANQYAARFSGGFYWWDTAGLYPLRWQNDTLAVGPNVIYPGGGGGSGTVTSVAQTVPSFLSVSGSPITTSGTLAIYYSGTALPIANGGTNATTWQDAIYKLTGSDTATPGTLSVLTVLPGGGIGFDTISRGGGGSSGVSSISFGTTGLTPSSATTGVVTVAGILGIANGGTGQNNANSALNALLPSQSGHSGDVLTSGGTNASWITPAYFTNPMTTLGDIIYENATPAATRLAGQTTTTKKFLTQTGNGTISAAPAWSVIANADLPYDSSKDILNQNSALQTASYRISGTGSVGASDTIGTDLILGHYLWNSVYLTADINSFYIMGFNDIGIMNAVTATAGQVPISLGSNIFTAGHTGDSVFRGYKFISGN
jgi:hypothetical protein